jgi:hypothetical protein
MRYPKSECSALTFNTISDTSSQLSPGQPRGTSPMLESYLSTPDSCQHLVTHQLTGRCKTVESRIAEEKEKISRVLDMFRRVLNS